MKKFLVGGAVRDQLLNFPFSEKDWVVVGSTPEQMKALGFRPVGKDFPVFLHPETGEEYALARTERKTAPGYKGFTFHTDPSVSLEEDLERRDLTINAIAQDDNGELIDPFDGQEDIEHRRLRHVSLAFAEDPVRILRVARFSARYHHLGFTVAEKTLDLMYAMVLKGETKHLVTERVWQELVKALQEKTPQQFFNVLKLCSALDDIFPELNTATYQTSMDLLSKLSTQTTSAEIRFSAICHPLKKSDLINLCERLGAPANYRDMASCFNLYAQKLIDIGNKSQDTNALEIANTFKQFDIIRKPTRFHQILEASAYLFSEKNSNEVIKFWQNAFHFFKQADPQSLIEQGYEKAELGKAIFQQRIKKLDYFLSNRNATSSQHD